MTASRRSVALLLFLAACEESRSKDAKVETHKMLVEDLEAERLPSDGGGRAFLAPDSPREARVGEPIRLEIVYEAGPLGIEEGGALFLQPSPFWGWDPPQTEVPEAPGYTEISTEADGIELEPSPLEGLLAIHVRGRKLEEGERVLFRYRTRGDRFAEKNERVWVAVDGDGDGVRAVLPDSPTLDVLPGEPARLVLTLPTTARPGEIFRPAIAVLDAAGNRSTEFEGDVTLVFSEGLKLPRTVTFTRADFGVRAVEGVVEGEGVFRVRATTSNGHETESNPMVARDSIPRILWGDLHGHSQLSDGTGTPEDYFLYARDVAALDVVSLTDHDHWGLLFLDAHPGLWKTIRETARRFDEPGRFVTLLGYEWTSWIHGHRHVLYFDGEGEVLSSLDPRYETPALLWKALEDRKALTFAHHSAGGPVSTNWDFVPPEDLEPVTEVVSVHGSSEASDSPGTIYSPVPGNFVRDVLDRGLRFGFIGSGDSHDGHPGLVHLAAPSGGLAAIFSEERTAASILEALRARRTYATNGARIWLRTWLDEEPMGSIVPSSVESREFRFAIAATAPVERIDVVRSGKVLLSIPGEGRRELSETLTLSQLHDGEYLYVRVVQEDGGAAWSSPFYVGGGSAYERDRDR